ncbi:MAG: orotidine 5'-phosphate decarboxylase [Thermoplasmata archaeon]|uniref:Orotidine 5'-phosphate decarboxylase n=1 Tax=Candidatus Sysuiplasma superficiale TaxID=2823368 RepID=A0A8J8CDU4_9ARCH|nr:orotidine 5'-phosphate decarboxylase [Candidatus Sysuiplasma superficiale]MBX8643992.1 orotidine 5'-phosphate decarboxylase [Candidatus Sysuiplasma superficiale]
MKVKEIDLRKPTVQVSLDLQTIAEADKVAQIAVEAGIDWIEVGTPLILGEGLHAVEHFRKKFPEIPIVADLKTMDGGYLEAEMMAKAGANFVVVMAASHPATVRATVKAARDYGIYVMGDVLGRRDRVQAAKELEMAGVDVVIAHLGFDERNENGGSPLDFLSDIVSAVSCPVQAVGGLSLHELPRLPSMGAPLVVIGAPLVIDSHSFSAANEADEMRKVISNVCRLVKKGADRREDA